MTIGQTRRSIIDDVVAITVHEDAGEPMPLLAVQATALQPIQKVYVMVK